MPIYIPWLSETIKKRGVRYLLHHYLGQFFLEKLTLEQLSIDIYEGKGSIRDLALDVDGLNDELDFIPFRFLEGCSIGQISVEVPWSSLATEACKVELDGARFVCRLKTSGDAAKTHCTESTLLSRSLMTSSMQMAEDIVTTEDDDDYASAMSSSHSPSDSGESKTKQKDATQMFEGLEMFAQLIDSVLRRTKLTARNTLFQIQSYHGKDESEFDDDYDREESSTSESSEKSCDDHEETLDQTNVADGGTRSQSKPKEQHRESNLDDNNKNSSSKGTVEFFIKFFRCEELVDGSDDSEQQQQASPNQYQDSSKRTLPESLTKLITLEEVEMRIDGVPVSNLIGKHAITIKFNGQKSEISIYSGSPLLAVISHKQLDTFIDVFDSAKNRDQDVGLTNDKNQKMMSQEDYAKIENQLLEDASLRNINMLTNFGNNNEVNLSTLQSQQNPIYCSSPENQMSQQGRRFGGRSWNDTSAEGLSSKAAQRTNDFEYHSPNSSNTTPLNSYIASELEPTLDNIEAFSCELKLPGIWLCILRSDEVLPPLIKPHADSINSFQSINRYIDQYIKVPHIRCLALKVSLDITAAGTNINLGDLNIIERFKDDSIHPHMTILQNDMNDMPLESARYKASIVNKDIVLEFLTNTRLLLDPTIIDRLVYNYKLFKMATDDSKNDIMSNMGLNSAEINETVTNRASQTFGINLTMKGDDFTTELRCPIPDLTPEGLLKDTELRPQSFLVNFKKIFATWQSDRLNLTCSQLSAFVKTQPNQSDNEAIKFIEASDKDNEKIILTLEPSPSNLDTAFTNDVEQVLNESSMYDSIYVSQATESRIAAEPFQTKRKVVRASTQDHTDQNSSDHKMRRNECDHEKILTPGDREHLESYLGQTAASTRFSINLHLPVCDVEFEDKEQLDLIYNRFGNDFVFWQPRCLNKSFKSKPAQSSNANVSADGTQDRSFHYKEIHRNDDDDSESSQNSDRESEASLHSMTYEGSSNSDCFDNLVTCKITVGEFFVKFNHQNCAAALQQDITVDNLLFGLVVDVNKKPNTVLSLVADNIELRTDSNVVLQGNTYSDKSSIFGLSAEIKRPTKSLKDIKLAIQLINGLFNDFKSVTFTRFWQSINVTDEPITGYIAPRIVTELHIDILDTALSLTKEGARPALLSIDELYLTSMVMEKTSKVMIRMIADEVSLYLKRDKQAAEIMKNYICLVDSGVIDSDVEFSDDGRLEFGVINNVITVRVCQDSLISLCKLFNVMVRGSKAANQAQQAAAAVDNVLQERQHQQRTGKHNATNLTCNNGHPTTSKSISTKGPSRKNAANLMDNSSISHGSKYSSDGDDENDDDSEEEEYGDEEDDVERALANLSALKNAQNKLNLLEDAMNDYDESHKPTKGNTEQQQRANKIANTNAQDNIREDSDGVEGDDDAASDASSLPPAMMHRSSDKESESGQSSPIWPRGGGNSLLDESNPGDLSGQPLLVPTQQSTNDKKQSGYEAAESLETTNKAIDESAFFVIGDDDVGAGIINHQHLEPAVRKLIDGPVQIVENHFKMTKPRTLPEMLATSLERYVLREMTLVINLYGGRDFDDLDEDNPPVDNDTMSNSTSVTTNLSSQEQDRGSKAVDSISTSVDNLAIRGRANSLATGKKSSLKQSATSESAQRRKHLSESSKDVGGTGGGLTSKADSRVRFGEGAVNLWESLDLMSSPDFMNSRRQTKAPLSIDSKLAGGTWRQTDVCIQLTLSKVKVLYELNDPNELTNTINGTQSSAQAPISWRFMLFIQDFEICDLVQASDINKMLYEYCTESMPKRSTQILTIKNIATVNPSDGCEECDLRISLKPLRLNIDQDTLLFLIEFFTALNKAFTKQQPLYATTSNPTAATACSQPGTPLATTSTTTIPSGSARPTNANVIRRSCSSSQGSQTQQPEQATINQEQSGSSGGSSISSRSSSRNNSSRSSTNGPSGPGNNNMPADCQQHHDQLPTHCHSDLPISGSSNQYPIYIKSFTFSPDVPIRLDYHAKHLDFEQGAIAGILMGLAHLDHSELVLKRVQAKHGMRGLDRVLLFMLNSWLQDIKRNQLPSILGGVGPMHSVIQLFQGMRDLIWMPIDHYRKDRRLVRGLQRGASSFSSSTAMAAINLVNRFISIVQCTAQIAYDIVTPPNHHHLHHHHLSISSGATHSHHHASHNHRCHHKHSLASTLIGAAVTSMGVGVGGSNHGAGSNNNIESRSSGRRTYATTGSATGSGSSCVAAHRGTGIGAGTSVSGGVNLSPSSRAKSIGGGCGGSGRVAMGNCGLSQPRNFCEGVAVGYTVLKEGFNDTARNVACSMQAEDVRSAVGELVRQIPSTLLNPIISATEGAQNVLVGIRNQIAPDARRDDQEKWKRRVRRK